MHLNLVIHFSQQPQHSCHRFLFVLESSSFWAFSLVVHQPCNAENRHLSQALQPIFLSRIGTQADANIHKTFACKYLSNNICKFVVEEWTHGYFCLGYFSSSTHFDLVIRLAQKAWRQCVLVYVHGLGFRDGTCIGLLADTGLFLSTGNRYLFLLQRRKIPFDS